MNVTETYSGIVVEQNAPVSGMLDWRGQYQSEAFYQTFWLPSDYVMGTTASEQRIPNLSGLQVMVDIDEGYASAATLSYTLDYYINGSGWSNLIAGTTIGSHTDGQCWMNLIFPQEVEMDATIAGSLMRLGVVTTPAVGDALNEPVQMVATNTYLVETETVQAQLIPEVPYPLVLNGRPGFLLNHQGSVTFSAQQGVGGLYYTESSRLAPSGALYGPDRATLVLDAESSLNFRVLALTADSGTSFLGDEYRSCVIQMNGAGTDTGTEFWMSTPQPSPFAVVSRYFDLRPSPTVLPYETINLVPNPSFEYDFLSSTSPYGWTTNDSNSTRNNLEIVDTWAASGDQSLRSTNTFNSHTGATAGLATPGFGTTGFGISSGQAYSAEANVNILSLPPSTGLTISLNWYDINGNLISTTAGNTLSAPGEGILTIVGATPPGSAVYATLIVSATCSGSGVLDFQIDAVQFTQSATVQPYGDGDLPDWVWTSQRGRSPSGEVSNDTSDEAVVVDGVLVDPATPNMAFNVYYSSDDTNNSDNMSESDWEGKLWTRVPQVYTCTQRQQYVFPEPVVAKYFKLEFCNLNAQTYTPGTFQQPVTYKKMPTWVADFFIVQLELPSFTANVVAVQDDALTLAYDYYLDDLGQSPNDPSAQPENTATLTSYFSQSDAANYVDATTLAQINLIMNTYQVPTGSIVDPSTLLGNAAQQLNANNNGTLTQEVPSATSTLSSTVSTLNRESVVFEQSMPVMYFFLTCRHAYKQVAATFPSNKAYFAGTNDIEFLRANYDVETDSDLYIESGADSFNADLNDFVLDDDGDWYVYAT